MLMLILIPAKAIRQAESARTEPDAQGIGQPFGQKINARLAIQFNIGAKIEEFMGGNRFEQKRREPSTDARAKVAHGKGNE